MSEATNNSRVVPVILAGGSGTRLWPLSRSLHPKQFLPLMGEESLLVATCRRVADPTQFDPPVVICNSQHRFLVAEQLRAAGIVPRAIILEPVARGTAAAAAIAALFVVRSDPAATLLMLAADSYLRQEATFLTGVALGAAAAAAGKIVVFGVTPKRPETGFGYIKSGKAMENAPGVLLVDAFVEKPDRAQAEVLITSGKHLWNSGNFLFRADTLLQEFAELEPSILEACRRTLCHACSNTDFLMLDEPTLVTAPSNSLDRAIMERTGRAAVVPIEVGWSDIGSWDALWRESTKDADGNHLSGDVFVQDVHQSYIRSGGRLIASVGIDNVVVVETDDAVFIASRERAAQARELVERLQQLGRPETVRHLSADQPWGSSRRVDCGDRFLVQRLIVNPGARISGQTHPLRTEHWIVAQGTARVTVGDQSHPLGPGESICVPPAAAHRLENPGTDPLCLIKVLTGPSGLENDIASIEDGRGTRLAREAEGGGTLPASEPALD